MCPFFQFLKCISYIRRMMCAFSKFRFACFTLFKNC